MDEGEARERNEVRECLYEWMLIQGDMSSKMDKGSPHNHSFDVPGFHVFFKCNVTNAFFNFINSLAH